MSSTGAVNSKWPDFRFASTLRNFLGSQPDAPDKPTPINGDDSNDNIRQHEREQRRDPASDEERDNQLRELHILENNGMESREDLIDGGEALDIYQHDAQIEDANQNADDDFGTLEMFDSNAVAVPYSSQMPGESAEINKAPEAVMSEDFSTRKSKRDKKERKRKGEASDSGSSQLVAEEGSALKQKKSKRKSAHLFEISDSLPTHAASAVVQSQAPELNQEPAVTGTQTKRKRNSSDSSDGKKRKKRKSLEQGNEIGSQEVIQGTQNEDAEQPGTHDSSFLRTRDAAHTAAIYDDIPDDAPNSPSDTRQQSRVRKDGVEAHPDQMDVDSTNQGRQGNNASQDLGTNSLPVNGTGTAEDNDVENLAREAWNEHISGQPPHSDALRPDEDLDVPTSAQHPQKTHDVYDVPASPVQSSIPASTKRTRSARAKKAKPTFFEKSPSPENPIKDEGFGLPSPSAVTPKPRRRAKKATNRKQSEAQRMQELKLEDVPGDEGEDGEFNQARRNRMAGFTQGRFSDEELGRIARAVEGYRAEYDLSSHHVNEMLHAAGGTTAGDEHAALWGRIFTTCPDRHRQKIINITRKKFHNFVARGTWTHEQDAELRDLIEANGTKWSKIAGIINRHPEDLRDRYRNYIVCGDAQRKDSWDETEEANLTQYVMEAMSAIDELRRQQPSRELLKKPYEELIDWQNISERMLRTRSRLQCITKWKAMNFKTHGKDKLISQAPDSNVSFRLEKARRQLAEMPDEERYRLVLAINGVSAATESKVPWAKLVDKQFRVKWHRPTQMLLWRRLKHTVPDWETKSVRDCAQYIVDQYNQTGELPTVEDEHFNDAQETAFISTIPLVNVSNSNGHSNLSQTQSQMEPQHHVSAEYVDNSDVENDGAAGDEQTYMDIHQGLHDENIQPDLPMAIDPALEMNPSPSPSPPPSSAPVAAMAPIEAEQPAEPIKPETTETSEPAPPRATKTAKRSGFGKGRPPRKTATPAKRVSRRNAAPSQDPIEDGDVPAEENTVTEAERPRKKRTLGKFRSVNSVDHNRADDSDSVMDDMDDLPARVAV